jgi:hypothetical protein
VSELVAERKEKERKERKKRKKRKEGRKKERKRKKEKRKKGKIQRKVISATPRKRAKFAWWMSSLTNS